MQTNKELKKLIPKNLHKRNYNQIIQNPQNNIYYIIQSNLTIITNYLNNLLNIDMPPFSFNNNNNNNINNNIDEPEDDNDEEIKIYLSVFNPKTIFLNIDEEEDEENEEDIKEEKNLNNSEQNNIKNKDINFIDKLVKLFEFYINKLNTKKVDISGEKRKKIINAIKELIDLFSIFNSSLGKEVSSIIKNKNDFEYYLSNLFLPEMNNKKNYSKISESIKIELINAKKNKIFTTSQLSEMTFIAKKNINNWCKKGARRKKGCGKKKILLPLREKIGNYLKNNINGKKFKKKDIKIKVKELGATLVAKNIINQEELDKFLISDSWIKQLCKEYLK